MPLICGDVFSGVCVSFLALIMSSTWWKFLNQIPKTIRDLLHWYRNKKTEGQSSATVFSLVKWIPLQLLIVFCYPLVFLQDREKNVTNERIKMFLPKKISHLWLPGVHRSMFLVQMLVQWCWRWVQIYREREREKKETPSYGISDSGINMYVTCMWLYGNIHYYMMNMYVHAFTEKIWVPYTITLIPHIGPKMFQLILYMQRGRERDRSWWCMV